MTMRRYHLVVSLLKDSRGKRMRKNIQVLFICAVLLAKSQMPEEMQEGTPEEQDGSKMPPVAVWGQWYFRITDEQYHELTEGYWEAYKTAEERIKDVMTKNFENTEFVSHIWYTGSAREIVGFHLKPCTYRRPLLVWC